VVAETIMERGLVTFEDLIYPKLVDQPAPPRSILAGTGDVRILHGSRGCDRGPRLVDGLVTETVRRILRLVP